MPPIPFGREFIASTEDAFWRLAAATMIGAAVGINRELRGKPAGMRTHALVSLGSAVVVLSIIALATITTPAGETVDANAVSRAMQGIIAGVGFLGGGVILKTSDRSTVRNLTTAASIWVVACLGIVCGAGQWSLAAAALALTLVVLMLGGPAEGALRHFFINRRSESDGLAADQRRADRRRTGEQRSVVPSLERDDEV
jgi:putative Mg2+ transporter-C (MgtC) family protein